MSGAVKGKDVIMKIEIDREMTGLMQQIKDLNAQKAGLFVIEVTLLQKISGLE